MVTGKSGSFTLSCIRNMKMNAKCYWQETYDQDANTSVISVDVKMIYVGGAGAKTYYPDGTVSVNGSTVVTMSSSLGTHKFYGVYNSEAAITAGSGYSPPPWSSGNITHDSDGKKSVAISLNFRGYSKDGTGASGFEISGSQTIELTTIPRASTISSAANTTLGNKCSVKWTPLSTSFRYKLKFSLDEWSYTTEAINPGTTSAYTYTGYTIPMDVADYISSTSNTGTMTVALYTYSDAACSNMVGSMSTKAFTVTIPENEETKPSVSFTAAPVNSFGDNFTGIFIQRMSRMQAEISASGKHGASISSKALVFQGKTYDSPFLTDFVSASGQLTVKAVATDSRGFTGEAQAEITVVPYQKPSLLPASGESAIVCARCDGSGQLTETGAYLRIIASRSYSKVMAGDEQKNFCEIRFRYKEENAEAFSGWETLLERSDTSADTVDTGAISGVVLSVQKSYVVQVGVADDLGETYLIQFNVPTDFVTIDCPDGFKGKRMGVFRYVDGTEEDGVYVGLPIFGGSIDSLLTGSKLTATADAPISLSELKTPGCYFCPDADNAQYVTDCPYTDGGFRLEVREIFSKDTIRQKIDYGSTILVRHWNGEAWSAWLRVLTETMN